MMQNLLASTMVQAAHVAPSTAPLAASSVGVTSQDSYDIDLWGMLIAIALVAVATLISAVAKLGVERSLPIAAARAIVQLAAMGIILRWVIEQGRWWWVVLLMLVMLAAAVQITLSRAKNVPSGLALSIFLTLAASMITMVLVVVELIVRPVPWYSPRVILPLAGMMLGNSVSAVALALSRFFEDMTERRDEVETMLALGASPREASMPSIRSAMRMGLMPTVASLASAGIVTIPGMMAGQILAGNDPLTAAKYQFVVLAAIAALTMVSDALILHLVYGRCFTALHQYQPIVPRTAKKNKKK